MFDFGMRELARFAGTGRKKRELVGAAGKTAEGPLAISRNIHGIAVTEADGGRAIHVAKKGAVEFAAVLVTEKDLLAVGGEAHGGSPVHPREIALLGAAGGGDHEDNAGINVSDQDAAIGK